MNLIIDEHEVRRIESLLYATALLPQLWQFPVFSTTFALKKKEREINTDREKMEVLQDGSNLPEDFLLPGIDLRSGKDGLHRGCWLYRKRERERE